MIDFFVVGIGGFIGSCFRFALNKAAVYFGISFPLGTLLSNVIAGFAIGLVIGLGLTSPRTKLFITTGLLGGLSTFSTFSLETINLFNGRKTFFGYCKCFVEFRIEFTWCNIGNVFSKILNKKGVIPI